VKELEPLRQVARPDVDEDQPRIDLVDPSSRHIHITYSGGEDEVTVGN
jgi:hypothetical protein